MGPFVAQGFAAFLGCLAMLTISLTLNWAGPSLPKLLHEESSGNDENEIKITSEEGSWIVSMTILAAVFGPLFSTFLVDRIGRKWSLGGVVIIMSISWVIVGIARTVVLLTIGRFIGGLAVGAGFPLTAMYLGEIAEDRIRGALGSVLTVALVLGQVLIFSVGPWISRPMLSLFSASPLIIFLLGFPWIPETPHYWLMKGAREKAAASLTWLRQTSNVEEELCSLEMSVAQELKSRKDSSIATLFLVRGNRRAFLIGFGLMTFQQFTGSYAIMSYAGIIFESSGLTGFTNWSLVILGMFELVAGLCSLFVIDSVGRRTLLLLSSPVTATFMLLVAVYFHLQSLGYDTSSYSWVPLIGLIGFNVTVLPGLGGVTWLLLGEIFPTNVKAIAFMILSIYGSLLGFAFTKLYEPVSSALGIYWLYYGFAFSTYIAIIFIYLYVPETKRLSFEVIQKLLDSGSVFNSSEDLVAVPAGK